MATPELVVIAGPNGAGKSTFYEAFLAQTGMFFVNADVLALKAGVGAYEAAKIADALRRLLVESGTSFIFETVFSDPVGEKVQFMLDAVEKGYDVTLCFIGIGSSETSLNRVAMRVSQGGHDVPDDKLEGRYPRSLRNLSRAIRVLPKVRIYDNSDLRQPYRHISTFRAGVQVFEVSNPPDWFTGIIGPDDKKA